MSITVQNKLKKLDLPRSEKQVAVAMAGHLWENAPEKGTWVGAEKIAAECSMGERTVFRAISALKKKDILRFIGYEIGKQAKMPKYTFHPESGKVLPLFESGEPARMASSESAKRHENLPTATREPANYAENLPPCPREPATLATDKGVIKKEQEGERITAPLSSFSGTKPLGQDISQLRRHPQYEPAKALVKKLVARAQNYCSVVFGKQAVTDLLAALLDDPQIIAWEQEVLFQVFDHFADSLPSNDDIDRTAAAGRIAAGYVAALLGDGTQPNAREKYFRKKTSLAAAYAQAEREAVAIREENRQIQEENNAGKAFLRWESENGGIACDSSGYVPTDESAFNRWLLRDQMTDAYAAEKKVLQTRLEEMRKTASTPVCTEPDREFVNA
jgi:hypothetical protein